MSAARPSRTNLWRGLTIGVALVLWITPPPDGLTVQAWRLFILFAAAIFSNSRAWERYRKTSFKYSV